MAHGKESPRQKMIGMMYLVLTAMLAMNVSKEVLDAFILVNDGLVETTQNFSVKNEGLYDRFAMAYEQNPEKVGDWKDRAEEVRTRSNELYDFINECKVDIVKVKDDEAIHDGEVHLAEVNQKDNTNTPGEIMIVGKKGAELKQKIEDHREFLLSLIADKEKYATISESIKGNLNTEAKESLHAGSKKGLTPTWESTYFEFLPLASVITLLSKMQGDVRNVEAEMLNFLLGQVDAGALRVNTLEAVVIPERSLVFRGQEYRAKVFLAAYDSTKMPEVTLSDGTMLDVESGKGIYSFTSNTTGIRKWGGTIQIENEGNLISRSFETEFEIAEANATISATGMNVFYRGISNPVAISAGGVAESAVVATISGGNNISKVRPGDYIVKPGSQGDIATISVYANVDGSRTLMNRMDFRVKNLPKPDAKVEGVRGSEGNLSVGRLSRLQNVKAEADDFVFEVEYKVQSFDIAFQGSGGMWSKMSSDSERFTRQQKDLFRQLKSGQRVMIEKIKATGPDGVLRTLNNITITVI